jgi:polar amino acid transport system ATP-binding protein
MAKEGMTMVVVSHEMGFIREAADRIMVLSEGQIVEDASPQKLFSDPEHEKTRRFLSKIL